MDNKAMFVQMIGEALKLYSREPVQSIELKDENTAVITFDNGYTKDVNVAADSPLATMYDIYRVLM